MYRLKAIIRYLRFASQYIEMYQSWRVGSGYWVYPMGLPVRSRSIGNFLLWCGWVGGAVAWKSVVYGFVYLPCRSVVEMSDVTGLAYTVTELLYL